MLVYDREVYTSEGLESGKKRWVYDGQFPLPDLSTVRHQRREYSISLSEFKGKKQECIVIEESGVRYRYILSTGVDETEARVKAGHTYFIAEYYIWSKNTPFKYYKLVIGTRLIKLLLPVSLTAHYLTHAYNLLRLSCFLTRITILDINRFKTINPFICKMGLNDRNIKDGPIWLHPFIF